MKFYPLKVRDIVRETKDAVVIEFRIPEDLKETFQFDAGQYLTLKTHINGEEVRRSYSLCSSPQSGRWQVAVKKVPGGKFSTFANGELREGDVIDVMPPAGNFKLPEANGTARNYVAFAAGSGITPVISMIREFLDTRPAGVFTLFYGNRTAKSIIFKESLEALKNRYVDRFRIFHVLSRQRTDAEMFAGRIDSQKCQEYFTRLLEPKKVSGVFLCGPEEMIFELKEFLPKLGIDKDNIKFELFTTPGEAGKKRKKRQVKTEKRCALTLRLDGNVHKLKTRFNNNILDEAVEQGIDLPYSCKGGVCSTCKARLMDGNVEMEVNYALEEDEVDAGFILTCQSYPLTEEVTVDFDQ